MSYEWAFCGQGDDGNGFDHRLGVVRSAAVRCWLRGRKNILVGGTLGIEIQKLYVSLLRV